MFNIRKNKIILISVIVIAIIVTLIVVTINFPLKKKGQTTSQPTQTTQSSTSYTTTTSAPSDAPFDVPLPPNQSQLPAGLEKDTGATTSTQELNLRGSLPVMGDNYYIEYRPTQQQYLIMLFPGPNSDTQLTDEEISRYKKEALGWIGQFGVNIFNLNIEYNPSQAKDL